MSLRVVTVFGGTGFLGRRIVRHLREWDFSVRIASRHPERGEELFGRVDPHLRSIKTDIHDEDAVIAALAGAWGAVNAVSLYVERARETFHSVHVEAAGRIAALVHRAGLARLVQVSGIGADPQSKSLYIRKRGEGERAVRAAFAGATLIRPAVMFSADDAFLTTILALLRRLPVYPMFGRGSTKLQLMRTTWPRRSPARCSASTRLNSLSSAAVPGCVPTRNFSERSRAKPASSRYWFPSRLPHGTRSQGSLKCCRLRR
jgi:NADH dehydrogenase